TRPFNDGDLYFSARAKLLLTLEGIGVLNTYSCLAVACLLHRRSPPVGAKVHHSGRMPIKDSPTVLWLSCLRGYSLCAYVGAYETALALGPARHALVDRLMLGFGVATGIRVTFPIMLMC